MAIGSLDGHRFTISTRGYATQQRTVVSAPSAPTIEQNYPTSQYGQTIPVLYGKARVAGTYVWSPGVIVRLSYDENPYFYTGTTVAVRISARIRYGRPLVADSRWKVRRLWADGKLVYNAATGYRANGLSFREYDGHSSQGRDSTMVAEEGASNVSAHRGYLDIVVRNFDIGAGADQPPVFEAEWVQDADAGVTSTGLTSFFSDTINTIPSVNWETREAYGFSDSSDLLRKFSLDRMQEVYAVTLNSVMSRTYTNVAVRAFRYIPELDRIFTIGISSSFYGVLLDPVTGNVVAESADAGAGPGEVVNASAYVRIGNIHLTVCSSFSTEAVYIMRAVGDTVERTYLSTSNWQGYSLIECFTPGEVRADSADIWICADDKLVKAVLGSIGIFTSITEHATFADNAVYAVYHDSDVIVWTDNAQAIRIDGSTGATVWTKSVPYQITTSGTSRTSGAPDMHRLDGVFFWQGTDAYYFTNLDTGDTTTESKDTGSVFRYVYDGETNTQVTTNALGLLARTVFDAVGAGTTRDLEDFIGAVWEEVGYEVSEHVETNIDDTIDGAVIDITSGGRDVVRSVADPYSFAIFERAGQVISKRAATDGSFAVDATILSTDIVDRGGQAIRARRMNPEEFISSYGINYRDPDEIYQARPQFGEIPSIPFPVATADIGVKSDIPIIVDGDTIKTLATKKVNRLAVEKHEFTMTLRAKFCDLEPEDIIQFTFAGRLVTARIVETTMNPDFTIEVKATEFLSSTSVTISGAVGRPVEPDPVGGPASRYYHLDIPLLAGSHDLAGAGLVQYHVLASAGQTNWDGAVLYRDGVSVASQVTDGLVGVALEALPDWDIPYVTEKTRTLDVAFISGDTDLLTSATYLEMVNGANFFAIGAPGRWEVCQVMTIADIGSGKHRFTGLRRGRGSSEEYTGDHAIGDFVVWLSEDNVSRLEYALADLDEAFSFKPVGLGGSLASTTAVSRTVTGEAEKIPKPAHLNAVIDGSDIDLSWKRRARFGSYWDDDGDYTTPLGESLEQYVVRIKDGPGGTVVRTVTVDDAETYTYTAADQTTYSGGTFSAGDQITFGVRQVSGTGVICPEREATITL